MSGKVNPTDAAIAQLEATLSGSTDLIKSLPGKDAKGPGKNPAGHPANGDHEGDEEDVFDDDEDEEEGEGLAKALNGLGISEDDLVKSFQENPALAAVVASLDDATGDIGNKLDEMADTQEVVDQALIKGLGHMVQQNEALGALVKSLSADVQRLNGRLDAIAGNVQAVASGPAARKSAAQAAQVLEKSLAGQAPNREGKAANEMTNEEKFPHTFGVAPKTVSEKLAKSMQAAVKSGDKGAMQEFEEAAGALDARRQFPEKTWEKIKDK